MPELPTGTVTFLFTDIEGSTRLLHELGDTYAEALAEHRRVLRDAFSRHGGVAVHTCARVAAKAAPGEVLVTRTVKDLVAGSGLQFADRGVHPLKGIPDEWQLFAVNEELGGEV